jgi:hypothetical protein
MAVAKADNFRMLTSYGRQNELIRKSSSTYSPGGALNVLGSLTAWPPETGCSCSLALALRAAAISEHCERNRGENRSASSPRQVQAPDRLIDLKLWANRFGHLAAVGKDIE